MKHNTNQASISVLSLGGGVQSSTLALMAAHGIITPMPEVAFFADTHAEPNSVYKWLDWIKQQLPFEVIYVSGGNLTERSLTLKQARNGKGMWSKSRIPSFIKNNDGTTGLLERRCTYDHKVIPLNRAVIKLMREKGCVQIEQWIGISVDEAHRMKPSRDHRIINRWPLVDLRMSRHDCLKWMNRNGYPTPPRSACVYCPYHSDNEWRRLRDEEPEEFQKAVQFDRELRVVKSKTYNLSGMPFVHRSLVPLDQVDFSTDEDKGQSVMFGNECEGLCCV